MLINRKVKINVLNTKKIMNVLMGENSEHLKTILFNGQQKNIHTNNIVDNIKFIHLLLSHLKETHLYYKLAEKQHPKAIEITHIVSPKNK